jgi:HEAT repeat protein
MTRRRLYLLVLLILAGCQQDAVKKDEAVTPVAESSSMVDTETQLKINQEALLRGATDENRLDAAIVMLFNDSPRARQILIDALKQSENKPARVAVCRALVVSRETRRVIKNERDFIGPLGEMLRTEDAGTAKFAAEAALLYEYDEIDDVLETMAKDATLPVRARLNAIYAMKVQLDIRAITRLVELVDDKNTQVSAAARESLGSIGIPVGRDRASRARVISELRTRGMERFQRDWMIRQERRVSALERERDLWRKLYLGALGRIYAGLGDDGQRGKMLTEQLASSEPAVRLWALDKASQWRIGTQSKLPAEIGPFLIKLISDDDRDIRLATARLLSLTGELGSPKQIVEQLDIEKDDEVKLELFVALGAACQYALVPTSGVQLSAELRTRAMGWAAAYLNDEDAKKSHKGAEVMRKLLEPGGLSSEEAEKFLDMLVERYKRARQTSDGMLRGDLLGTMARLCGQSAYRSESARRFSSLFEKALNDETDLVREAAVDGLICIDKPKALRILAKDYLNDRSQIVRSRVMELAGEVGGKEDLSWLWDKVGTNSESGAAWQVMLKIFNGCDVNVVEVWLGRFDSPAGRQKLSDEQLVSFLELAERKAAGENRVPTLRTIREKLARLYAKTGRFERAAEYLGVLRESAKTAEQKYAVLGQLMDVYLRWPKLDAASQLITNRLLEGDVGADSAVVRSIDAFFDNPTGVADPNALLLMLRQIKPAEQRPVWEQNLARWNARFGSAVKDANSPAASK